MRKIIRTQNKLLLLYLFYAAMEDLFLKVEL